jgi:diketogulonate reductase-like aldo/keto reductase
LALEQTLHDLGVDYLDMYLIHWPVAELKPREGPVIAGDPSADDVPLWETFEAMNLLKEEGLVKGIGVSNFNVTQINDLINDCDLIPDVNQIELHPYLTQKKLHSFCESKGIILTAYSPLGMNEAPKGGSLPKLIENPRITDIAVRYSKTPSQILLRWSVQIGNVVIPKSLNPQHIEDNLNIFDFELTKEEVDAISALNANHRFVKPAFYDFTE